MCGFAGYWSMQLQKRDAETFLRRSGELLHHRGPDDRRITLLKNAGTCFTRLSILDLESGMQPVRNNSDGSSMVCNGQVYNYIELKEELPSQEYHTRGDIEVALNAYRFWGTGFPSRLNGMFAGAVSDPKRNRIVLFRDRFGIKPLYYTFNCTGFYFSSEIRPLLNAPGTKREIDRELLPAWFTYRYLPGNRTLFSGINKLLPGSVLVLDTISGSIRTEFYWRWVFDGSSSPASADEAEDRFISLFRDSVRIRLRSDVEVGSLISGGIDSSAVAAEAAVLKKDLKLFNIGFRESSYDESSEVDRLLQLMPEVFGGTELIREYCLQDGLRTLPELVMSTEEPISLGTMVPTDQVCRLASERLKVVLTGEGADEIFAGYRKFLVEAAALKLPGLPYDERRKVEALYPELKGRASLKGKGHISRHIAGEKLFSLHELNRLLGTGIKELNVPNDPRLEEIPSEAEPISAMQMVEALTRLPNYVNLRLDKLSMRHSLETRTPFLDYRLAEFAATLPLETRVSLAENREKHICRKAFERFGLLPPEVTRRRKKPFTMPIADWFSTPDKLPEPVSDILLGREVEEQGILDGNMVRDYARRVTGDGVGPETLRSAGDAVFAIVVFSLWHRAFFKEFK